MTPAESTGLPVVRADDTLLTAMTVIDQDGRGIVLVLDGESRLLGTVTDGDLRRALLANVDLAAPLRVVLANKPLAAHPQPVTARAGQAQDELLRLMQANAVRQLPLLDERERVVALVTLDELMPEAGLHLQAMIMAGGRGQRLRPLTDEVPKPMLPVGGRPVLERIVEQLRHAGIRRVSVATHYKPEIIHEHFGNGQAFGIEISYVNEDRPLGTGGAMQLLPSSTEPLLVINGDILTRMNYRAMLAFHQDHRASMTVAVRRYDLQVPYGVFECAGVSVTRLTEKPRLHFFVNAGIYLLAPNVLAALPVGRAFDMTDLIQQLLAQGQQVVSFPIREYWLDIGQHADYAQSQQDATEGKLDA
jgi:dTDP-glucose pyrophosphorylase/CBS domain-containing protein